MPGDESYNWDGCYPDGSYFAGTTRRAQPHGYGRMTYPAGGIDGGGLAGYTYEGTWVNGRWDTGVLVDSEGVRQKYRKGALVQDDDCCSIL
jgi:hypothetical protein